MSENRIIPECYADTLLIDILGYKKTNHQSRIGQVANTMLKKYQNRFAIGVIDNDKKTPAYFDSFATIKKTENIILKNKKGTKHYLIIICPAIDNWILNCASLAKIKPIAVGGEFRSITKDIMVSKNTKFKNFVNSIKIKQPLPWKELNNIIIETLKMDR